MADEDTRTDLVERLLNFTRNDLLGDREIEDLTARTPLLEWGVLNSMQTARLVAWIREELGVRIPPARIVSRNFRTLETVADLVLSLREGAA
ncbi:acyl carrier protein [Saccharothrix australiensis]|uniref:Phosphopantetheine binding protein n=1 Tax=Saccharothrix australiensis TaxID=2072 RepID=A0A495W3K4_9PSEU|nr:acyl carrier protein [Saccharothrix australiensis]RKT55627.1 phosphopantetheine binding protein [Saccharothrix australiensis]